MATETSGVVRVARQVLLTIIANVTTAVPGVTCMARVSDPWSRLLGREIPHDGISLSIKENTISADLYIVVAPGTNIVEVGSTIQDEVASAIADMVGMRVQEVNVYIQNVAE